MIQRAIQNLINYALDKGLIETEDCVVVRNALMDALRVKNWWDAENCGENCGGDYTVDEILSELLDYACAENIIEDTSGSRDIFDTKLMGILTPFPREVIKKFNENYAESPKKATNRYYALCENLNYVRGGRIAKNKKWKYLSKYGAMDITINLSKPEKDPRDIAAAGAKNVSGGEPYPKCSLCPENAGFAGNAGHPSRYNLRPVPVTLGGERWQLQYSPYGYYNEHCILFNEKHTPMIIDSAVFEKLFDAVDFLPHYFFGSNADLPIVGGSVLSHEHFQGGEYTFPIEKAQPLKSFKAAGFNDVDACVLKWPMSVLRLSSSDRARLSAACNCVLEKWRTYSDKSAGILAQTDGVPHNTITPIVRKSGDTYTCDLVLRNNRTTEERPFGIFHPNPSLHHIKKENIGLIEVMGLAILPSRLENELKELKRCMLSGESFDENPQTASHGAWAADILSRHADFTYENADDILKREVGMVFEQVLTDAGVFKQTPRGIEAFERFLAALGG